MRPPPRNGGGRAPTARPSAHFNQPNNHPTKSRLTEEVIPRLDGLLTIQAEALLGLGLFSLEDVAAGIITLAEKARQQVLVAEGERQLRGAA